MICNNLDLYQIPKGIHLHLRNLLHLDVSRCRIESVTREDLEGLEKLESLLMADNALTSLPDDLFIGFTEMETVDFSGNYIDALSSEVFKPVAGSLEVANFKGNSGIDIVFSLRQNDSYHLLEFFDDLDRNYRSYKKYLEKNIYETFEGVHKTRYRQRMIENMRQVDDWWDLF